MFILIEKSRSLDHTFHLKIFFKYLLSTLLWRDKCKSQGHRFHGSLNLKQHPTLPHYIYYSSYWIFHPQNLMSHLLLFPMLIKKLPQWKINVTEILKLNELSPSQTTLQKLRHRMTTALLPNLSCCQDVQLM